MSGCLKRVEDQGPRNEDGMRLQLRGMSASRRLVGGGWRAPTMKNEMETGVFREAMEGRQRKKGSAAAFNSLSRRAALFTYS